MPDGVLWCCVVLLRRRHSADRRVVVCCVAGRAVTPLAGRCGSPTEATGRSVRSRASPP